MAANARQTRREARQAARDQNRGHVRRHAGTPSGGNPRDSDLRSIAQQVEGLLDDEGHFNPNPDTLSRGHPDYDEDSDPRAQPRDEETGRFRRKSPPPESDDDVEDEELEQTAQGELDDDTEDDELQAADTEDAGDEAPQSDASDETSTDQADTDTAPAIESMAELAEALEISLDDFKASITHTFRAADEDVTVTLSELEAGYQKDADYRRSTQQLADRTRAIDSERKTMHQQYEVAQNVLAGQLGIAEQMVLGEMNSPQMEALRSSAPDEWSARQTELQQQLGYVQGAKQQAAAQFEQFRQEQLRQLKERETRALKEAIPDYGEKHHALAKQVITSLGYTPDEIVLLFDHRLLMGALELGAARARIAELEGAQTKAEETAARVKKEIPKLQRPGKAVSPQSRQRRVSRDKATRLRRRLRESGDVRDAAAVIETMLPG